MESQSQKSIPQQVIEAKYRLQITEEDLMLVSQDESIDKLGFMEDVDELDRLIDELVELI